MPSGDRAAAVGRWAGALRIFLVVAVISFWIGGFTFYAGVVIPTGASVLHSHARQGRITQQVTQWLNLSGAIALAVLLWNLLACRREAARWPGRVLAITWLAMAAAMVPLVMIHRSLDHLVLPGTDLLDADRFDWVHRMYVTLATAQWGAGVVHIMALAYLWAGPARGTPGTIAAPARPILRGA